MPVGGGARPRYPQTTATPSPSKFRMQFPHDTNQRALKNRRISTIRFQYLKYTQGNCMRNCWMTEGLAAVPVGGGRAWPGFEATRRTRQQRPGTTGVEGAGGSGGLGRASRSTTPSEARVWRSRGRPGPTAPGTPVGPRSKTTQQHTPTGGAPRGTPPVINTSRPTAVNQPQSINQHSLRRQRLRGADLRGPAAGQPGGDERGHDGDDAHADQL